MPDPVVSSLILIPLAVFFDSMRLSFLLCLDCVIEEDENSVFMFLDLLVFVRRRSAFSLHTVIVSIYWFLVKSSVIKQSLKSMILALLLPGG